MGRINRVVILFFLVILIAVSIFFQAIQTENFSNFVSQKISENILKKAGISLSFKKMEVKLFPPVTVLKEIAFKMGESGENEISLNAESLNLSYGLLDLLSNRFNVRRLKFVNGNIFLNRKLRSFYGFKHGKDSLKLTKTFSQIKNNFLNSLKVDLRSLVFERTIINFLDSSLEAESLELEVSSDEIEVSTRLKNFQFSRILKYPLDYLEFDFLMKEKEWRLNKLNVKSMIDNLSLTGSIKEIKNKNELNKKNIVKVYTDNKISSADVSKAITFSRENLLNYNSNIYHHIGIYMYKVSILKKFVNLKQTKSEIDQKLEQLRAIDNKILIDVILANTSPIGVDTEEDFVELKKIMNYKN